MNQHFHCVVQIGLNLLSAENFIKNVAEAFRDEIVASDETTTPEMFGSQIDTMLKDSRIAICPKLENIATALKTTLPKIPNAYVRFAFIVSNEQFIAHDF